MLKQAEAQMSILQLIVVNKSLKPQGCPYRAAFLDLFLG